MYFRNVICQMVHIVNRRKAMKNFTFQRSNLSHSEKMRQNFFYIRRFSNFSLILCNQLYINLSTLNLEFYVSIEILKFFWFRNWLQLPSYQNSPSKHLMDTKHSIESSQNYTSQLLKLTNIYCYAHQQ